MWSSLVLQCWSKSRNKNCGNSVDLLVLYHELAAWRDMADLDTVILGCTHFPLIKDEIQLCLPQVILWIQERRLRYGCKVLLQNLKVRSKMEKKNIIFLYAK